MRRPTRAMAGLLLLLPLVAVVAGGGSAEAGVSRAITLGVMPAPVGQTKSGARNRTSYWGRVTPARKGAGVVLQRRNTHGVWKTVSRTSQDRSGRFHGFYGAWPRATEVLRVRSRPGRTSTTISSPIRQRRTWALKFNENFSGTSLNRTRWRHRLQPMTGSRPCARPAADRVRVGNGVATLSVRRIAKWCEASPTNKAKGKYTNAMIGTTEKFRFKHGVFAARVKFPKASGMHGAFWLQGPGVTGAEIDVAEYFGAASSANLSVLVHHTNRRGTVTTAGKRGAQLPTRRILGHGKTPYNGYHVYAVHWTAHRYQFWLDGQLMMTTRRPHVSTSPEEIVLSLLTSDWEIRQLKSTKPVMRVDWVRVWQAR